MSTNQIQRGENLTIVATANTASNDPVQIGAINGIAQHDAGIGEDLTIATVGVFRLGKVGADVVATGDELYLADGLVTVTAGTDPVFGVAVEAALAGAVAVKLV